MAKKNIFDLYNEQNPQTPSTDDAKLARRDEDAEREKVVTKDEPKDEPKDEKKEEEQKAEPANAGEEKKDESKGGVDNGTV